MNVIEEFKAGQAGHNRGLYMGEGLSTISSAIHGVQKKRTYGIGAAPKVGKTTLADSGWVIEPYIDAMHNSIPIEFVYFSYEIDRISKEFDYICYFLYRDYGIWLITLPEGRTYKGMPTIELSSDYLRGLIYDDNMVLVTVDDEIKAKMIAIYNQWIIPMFGEFAQNGVQIKKGAITFYSVRENPTGMRNKLLALAESQGKFLYTTTIGSGGKTFSHRSGYKPDNPNKYFIIVTDHIRKLELERTFNLKQTMDKWLEYCTDLRNMCAFTFVHIVHINRSMSDIKRMMYMEDRLYPNSEDIKDTGNLPEEANYIFTMMNPNDDKYNLKKHFGTIIKNPQGHIIYPHLKTIHLVESRHCPFPQHFAVEMKAKNFKQFKPN